MCPIIEASVVVLPDAGGAGDEDEAVVEVGEPADAGRKPERLEARHLARDHAERERDLAALAEGVDAEARQAGLLVRGVELARLVERGEARRVGGADRLEHDSRSSAESSGAQPSSGAEVPSLRTIGGWPTLRWRSLAPSSTTVAQEGVQIHVPIIGRTPALV